MQYLLTPQNLSVLKSFCLTNTIFAFDYDGTLAPIFSNPNDAMMKSSTEKLFQKLCSMVPVAIISGRRIKDINKIIQFKPKYVIGNHGAEGVTTEDEMEVCKSFCNEWKHFFQQNLEKHLDLGISIEDKMYSLSLHYRNSLDPEAARKYLLNLLNSLPKEVRSIPGKFVFNIVSSGAPNKHSALIRIMEREKCHFGIYLGDDDTDEDIFMSNSSNLLTIRIGESKLSKAKYFLKQQSEVDLVLSFLVNTIP